MMKLRLPSTRRLKLLRRTLRERTALGRTVKELNGQNFQDTYRKADILNKVEIVDMLASIVMACPNLEKLTGFHISYNHGFDRLSHALCTRRHLKERVWLLEQPTEESAPRNSDSDDLDELYDPTSDVTETFLSHHSFWPSLTTLVLHSQSPPSASTMTFRAFIATFRSLPALSHLSLSGFSATEFTNRTLFALPSLRSLRLEHLPGITDSGLEHYFALPVAASLINLSLINLHITDLTVLATLFAHLVELSRLTLSQALTPYPSEEAWPLPASTDGVFRSSSLRYLHWSCVTPHPPTTIALAKAIKDYDLPSLRTLRAPTDDGTLQAVCAPRASITRPEDEKILTLVAKVADQQRKTPKRASMTVPPTAPPTLHKDTTTTKLKRRSMLSIRPSRSDSTAQPQQPTISQPLALNTKGKWKHISSPPLSPTRTLPSAQARPEPKFPSHIRSQSSRPRPPKTNPISLPAARIAAQSRLVAARKDAGITIIVSAPDGVVTKSWTMGSYLGLVRVPGVRYVLEPDVEGDETGQGEVVLAGVGEVSGGGKGGKGRREEPAWERVRVRGCVHSRDRGGYRVPISGLF
jgi:hypothetical protein